MSTIKQTTNKELVRVRVTANARRELVEKTPRGWKMSVKEPAQENRANVRVRTLLSEALHVPLSSVQLHSGHHTPSKLFMVRT